MSKNKKAQKKVVEEDDDWDLIEAQASANMEAKVILLKKLFLFDNFY